MPPAARAPAPLGAVAGLLELTALWWRLARRLLWSVRQAAAVGIRSQHMPSPAPTATSHQRDVGLDALDGVRPPTAGRPRAWTGSPRGSRGGHGAWCGAAGRGPDCYYRRPRPPYVSMVGVRSAWPLRRPCEQERSFHRHYRTLPLWPSGFRTPRRDCRVRCLSGCGGKRNRSPGWRPLVGCSQRRWMRTSRAVRRSRSWPRT
jgi:hypothetical protein